MRTEIPPQIEYINNMYVTESQVQVAIREQLSRDGKEGINVSAHEGLMLSFFIKSMNIKNIVEVGTLYGYSTSWMASALPDDGVIFSLEKSEGNYSKSKALFGEGSK